MVNFFKKNSRGHTTYISHHVCCCIVISGVVMYLLKKIYTVSIIYFILKLRYLRHVVLPI